MMDVVYGLIKNQLVAQAVSESISTMSLNGTLYFGYPVLTTADEKVEVDALLVSDEHSLVAFLFADSTPEQTDISSWQQIAEKQDKVFFAIENNLARHDGLREGRKLGVEVNTVTLFPAEPRPPENLGGTYCDIDHLPWVLEHFAPTPLRFRKGLNAALQRVTTIKPVKKRTKVTRSETRGAILKRIEREIANLDQWQKRAAIESPDGPQRVRGLAGSGKTVVLALKAAYLHAQHPDWKIIVTFHTRSLYQQIIDLIRRFSFEHLNDEPNWDNLRVMHAWGGRDRDGVYTQIANHIGVSPRDFLYGRNRYGKDDSFQGVCSELLSAVNANGVTPLFDAVLVDEAQDLPPAFFKLIYLFIKSPRRIVWAYDELQKLSEAGMPTTEEMFGVDELGAPRVLLANVEGRPRQDIILPVCYRNTPWALTLAHALGFGVYRDGGLVQHFDEPSLWLEIGYRLSDGELYPGARVSLERNPISYPDYFLEQLSPDDAVISRVFRDDIEQAEWIAESIRRNLSEDELEVDDILVIIPEAYSAKKDANVVMEALTRRGIGAHLAGVTTSRDEIFTKQSIAMANIFRSKGNEAPMVYVLNCHHCYSGHELITLRNILFTAITRSRAWIRLCGWGPDMDKLHAEIENVRRNRFKLNFIIPTGEELRKLRMIHRDRTADERARIKKLEKGLKEVLDAIRRGDIIFDNLPLEIRTGLTRLLNQPERDDEEL